jgi:hypothetical protein
VARAERDRGKRMKIEYRKIQIYGCSFSFLKAFFYKH